MFEIPASFNPLIIDVAFLVILILAFLVGFLRGTKSILFDILAKVVALVFAFSPVFSFLKPFILKYMPMSMIETPNHLLNYMFGLLQVLVATFTIYYVLLYLLRVAIAFARKVIGKKKRKGITSRVFGGLINVVSRSIVLMLLLYLASIKLFGIKTTIDKTPVSKHVLVFVEEVFNNEQVKKVVNKEKLLVQVVVSDVFTNISDEQMNDYKEAYDEIITILDDPTEYYAPLEDTDIVAQKATAVKILKNLIVITDLSTAVYKNNPGITLPAERLINEIISKFPNGFTVDYPVPKEIQRLRDNLAVIKIDLSVEAKLLALFNN